MRRPAKNFVKRVCPLILLLALTQQAGPAHARDFSYVFQAGDNPWEFAQAHLTPGHLEAFLKQNGIADPYRVAPGTEVRVPGEWLFRGSRPARVLNVTGEVVAIDRRGRRRPVVAGDWLKPSQQLRTSAQSGATVKLADGSHTVIRENTEVRLEKNRYVPLDDGRDIHLQVQQGKVENEVEKQKIPTGRFQIRTPSGIAAVRGTQFRLSLVDQKLRTEVVEGKVAVNARGGNAVPLAAGNGIVVDATGKQSLAPLLPAPALANEPLLVERLPFELPVAAIAGAVGYRTLLSATGAHAAFSGNQQLSQPVLRIADVPDGTYTVHFRAIDALGLEGLETVRAVTINARPVAPFTLAPPPEANLTSDQPTLRWTSAGADLRYRLQVSTTPDFATPLIDQSALSEPAFTPPAPLAEGAYFWRIASISATEGQGPFGSTERFQRVPASPGNLQLDPKSARLRWQQMEGATYQVQVSRDTSFTAPVVDQARDENSLPIDSLDAGTYYVRVMTMGRSGLSSPWSEPQSFVVESRFDWRPFLLLAPVLFLF